MQAVATDDAIEDERVAFDEFLGSLTRREHTEGADRGQVGSISAAVGYALSQYIETRYAIDLRSLTGGRGAFTMKFSHYEEVPSHLADRLIAEAQKAKEEAKK